MMMEHIFYLSGFMASGKSTIGPIVANTLGWDYFDLDEEIEKKENKKITKIFSDEGENHFRQRESEVLRKIAVRDKLIISLGGGTLIKPDSRLKYKKDRPVLLKNSEEEVDQETYIERIESLMEKRKDFYLIADYTFNTDADSVGETVDKITRVIRNSIST
jgi:shikimate kinase